MNYAVILLIWFAFVALVYLYAWLDCVFYNKNVRRKAKQLFDAITEDE